MRPWAVRPICTQTVLTFENTQKNMSKQAFCNGFEKLLLDILIVYYKKNMGKKTCDKIVMAKIRSNTG